jgi:hypothetical protein
MKKILIAVLMTSLVSTTVRAREAGEALMALRQEGAMHPAVGVTFTVPLGANLGQSDAVPMLGFGAFRQEFGSDGTFRQSLPLVLRFGDSVQPMILGQDAGVIARRLSASADGEGMSTTTILLIAGGVAVAGGAIWLLSNPCDKIASCDN